jgi:hypothetical protein
MTLWHWYVARRTRRADERRLAERIRDDPSVWRKDPQRAMDDAGERITELNKPYDTHGW